MKNKLKRDHEEYQTGDEKIAFIFSRKTGEASNVLLPYIQSGPFQVVAATAAFKALSAYFQDRHRKSKAHAALKKLLREGADYHTFYTEFMELALISEVSLDSYKRELADWLARSIRMPLFGPEYDATVDFDKYQVLASQIANGKVLYNEETRATRFEKRTSNRKDSSHPKGSAATSTK